MFQWLKAMQITIFINQQNTTEIFTLVDQPQKKKLLDLDVRPDGTGLKRKRVKKGEVIYAQNAVSVMDKKVRRNKR